jgi:hypothetical protein
MCKCEGVIVSCEFDILPSIIVLKIRDVFTSPMPSSAVIRLGVRAVA